MDRPNLSADVIAYPRIDSRFLTVAEMFGDRTAINSPLGALTYRQLRGRADDFAALLRTHMSDPCTIVAIDLCRGPDLAACMLAVLSLGSAYVAMGNDWSAERKRQVAETTRAALWVTENGAAGRLACRKLVGPHDLPPCFDRREGAEAVACIFLTSGTTGTPKSVLTPHRAITRLFVPPSPLAFDPAVRMGVAVLPAWDAFALELFAPLLSGGTAIFCPDSFWHPLAIRRAVADKGLNCLWVTASLFNLAVEEDLGCFAGIAMLIVGGERLSVRHVRRFIEHYPDIALWNGYGPVETCIFATMHRIGPDDLAHPDGIPLGRPFAGSAIEIWRGGCAAGYGEQGEIVVSGAGLSHGYLGNGEINAAMFIPRPGEPIAARMYRTGDKGYVDRHGTVHYLGRLDRQVKLRGVRVDLGEIEQTVERSSADIGGCRVLVQRNEAGNATGLVLFCVPRPRSAAASAAIEISVRAVFEALDIAVPALHFVDRFAVTETGKLDEQYLWSCAGRDGYAGPAIATAPQPPDAQWLLDLVVELGGAPGIDLDADLVASGLDSLGIARLAARLSLRGRGTLAIADVLADPTPRALLDRLQAPAEAELLPARAERAELDPARQGFIWRTLAAPADTACHCLMIWLAGPWLARDHFRAAMVAAQRRHGPLTARWDCDRGVALAPTRRPAPRLLRVFPTPDPTEAIALVRRALLAPLDPVSGHIWHGAFCASPRPDFVVFGCAVHHVAFDALSESILARTIEGALANPGAAPPRTAPPRPRLPNMGGTAPMPIELLSSIPPIAWPPIARAPIPIATAADLQSEEVSHQWHFDAGTAAALARLARREGMLPVAAYLAALARAVASVTGNGDIVIGVPVNRLTAGEAVHDIGCDIGMAHVIVDCADGGSDDPLFAARDAAWRGWREAQRHVGVAQMPSPSWVRAGGAGRRFPAQILFALQPLAANDLALPHGIARFLRTSPDHAMVDLVIDAWPQADGTVAGAAIWDPALVDRDTTLRIVDDFVGNLLEMAAGAGA